MATTKAKTPRRGRTLPVTLLDKALPRFRDLFDEVLVTTKALRVPATNTWYLAAVSLHCSALDQVRGSLTLLEEFFQ
jgi:hypothetical protein